MAKRLIFFTSVVVALMALAIVESKSTNYFDFQSWSAGTGQLQCERELQKISLEACRQVVDQQLAGQLPWNTGLQMQCCQQLRDVSPKCRPVAISQVARQYEQQTAVPPKVGSFFPGETMVPQQQRGLLKIAYQQPEQGQQGQVQGQQGWYPSVTSPQQPVQGQQGWYPSVTSPQQQVQGQQGWYPSVTYPSVTSPQQQVQGQQGWYPSVTSPQQPVQGQQGWYPSVTSPQQPVQGQQGWYPSVTSPQQPAQGQPGLYPSVTSPQQPIQGQQGLYPSVTSPQQSVQGQQGQAQGAYQPGTSSPQQQQPASLQVAKAQQLAAQLPAMCRLEGGALSANQ